MAYNFVPDSKKVIEESPYSNKEDLLKVYDITSSLGRGMKDPIAIDPNNSKNIKVHRSLQVYLSNDELKSLKEIANLTTLEWGNGSRGNAGAGNRGIAFEKFLAMDLGEYITHRNKNYNFKYKSFMLPFIEDVLEKGKVLELNDTMGALNQRRSYGVSGSQPYIGTASISDIGKTVTDIDVIVDNKKHHLSLKMGKTVTFFNVGISRILPESEIKTGSVKNKDGLVLLNALGSDNIMFCHSFNSYGKTSGTAKEVDVTNKINKSILKNFLATGIGFGYYLVHADSLTTDKVATHYLTKNITEQGVTPNSVKIIYPQGNAKRVDIKIDTPIFNFKVNIRNKQGGNYPSHIMCDYSIKH